MNRLVRMPGALSRASPSASPTVIVRDVEPALGRDLLAPLGDERHLVRANSLGDGEHFVGAGHLEIEDGRHRCGESLDVVVLNVAAIFAQVRGDAVGAGALADNGSLNRVRLRAAARLSHRRDVIDVDVEALADHAGDPRSREFHVAPTMTETLE